LAGSERIRGKGKGVLLVLAAAALWGTLGTIYTLAHEWFNLTPMTIVFWRAALAALTLGVFLVVVSPLVRRGWSALRLRRADLPIFVAYGLLGATAFFLLYIYAVLLVGVAVAVVLLYTSPVFIALMAWRFLGEGFGVRKLAALFLTLVGAVLISRVLDSTQNVNVIGVLCGLGSAITYALYSIFGKLTLRRGYSIPTLVFYVYGIGTLGLLAVTLLAGTAGDLVAMGPDPGAWGLLLMLGTVQTLGTLALYTAGLRYLDAGVAGIVATFELVVASVLAFVVLSEPLTPVQVVGGLLILSAVVLLGVSTE
jgi:DME family drug/metabolite transporter